MLTNVSVTWFRRPVKGIWPFLGYPDAVRLDGHLFRRARFWQPYPGVVEQYREAVATNSCHLLVRADGTYEITHADGDNPDMGRPVEHLLNDHPIGGVIKVAAVVGGLALLIGAVGKG